MKKKNKKLEPEFYSSATNMPTINYNVYYMKPAEKALTFLLAFVSGALVGYLFYSGIGRDEFGQRTLLTWILDITIPAVVGIAAGVLFLPMRVKSVITKRRTVLAHQFRDLLDGLTTSLGAGKNVNDAFISVYDDLKIQYNENAYIVREMEVILSGIQNNVAIEDVLSDFGARSGIDDIKSFADIFRISYRKGGNIKDVIRNTHEILSDKMEISEEIETIVAATKMEQNIMIIMQIALNGIIKIMSPEFAHNFVTPVGIIATSVSIVIFVVAYYIGKAVMDIKI